MTRDGCAGSLTGIARRAKLRDPMEELTAGIISPLTGLEGDARGAKYPRRQITVLARGDWQAAIASLADLAGPGPLPWTTRRANLLIEGLRLPRAKGALIAIGPVILEVTGQTYPCQRMEAAHRGLLSALAPDWRGGVTCRVIAGGPIAIGDAAHVVCSPPERSIRLPG